MNSKLSRSRQRGFSLAEVMVATAILVVILVGILTLYDRANRVFKTGNEAAEMQQNVRIAYDRMIGDVRMAGFDYKRGGVLLPSQTAAPWAATRQYSAGTIVTATPANGHTYRATTSGTSGTSQPGWPTGTGATVVENGATPPITWQENGGAVYEQPDEQVEYAGATALTIRGNFDYSANEAGDTDHGREPNYESSQFPMVTTDNQEIVTYALVSDQAPAGTAPNNQTVTMFVDMNTGACSPTTTPCRNAHPGGVAERQVDITGVDLTNNNPPYTLYRFNFDDNGTLQRTPLATNIRSLNFFYFQDTQASQPLRDAANVLAPNIGGNGAYDPAVPNSVNSPDRLTRRKIRAIRVRLVGMNSQPDVNYADTSTANGQYGSTDTAGTPTFVTDTATVASSQKPMNNYRRVAVDTVVVPRNLGVSGMAQTFLQPPPRPTITNVCVGYCGIAQLSWDPNTNNPNASYVVMWDRSCTGSFSNSFDAGTSNTFAVDLTQEDLSQPFCFEVRAFNAGGSVFSTNTMSASVQNATTPNPPRNVQASGNGTIPPIAGKVRLTWTAPTTNASGNVSCTTGTPSVTNYLREIRGFRVYRSTTANDNAPNQMTLLVDENTSGSAAPRSDGYGNYTYDDTGIVCGTNYYYRVQTIEWCAQQNNYNTSGQASDAVSTYEPVNTSNGALGRTGSGGTPQTPVNFQVAPDAPNTPPLGLTASSCSVATNLCTVNMSWTKVTQDTTGAAVSIDSYELERDQFTINAFGAPVATGVNSILTMTNALAQTGSSVLYTDNTVPYRDTTTFLRYTYKYKVRALQTNPPTALCPASNFSAWVDYPPPCTFTGSVIVQTGASAGDGLTPATSWVMNTGDTIQVNPPSGTTFVDVKMDVIDPSGTSVFQPVQERQLMSPALFTWANLTPGVVYTITFTMTNNAVPPCTEQLVRYIQQEPLPSCALTTFAMSATILRQTATNYQLQLDLTNAAPEALNLTELDMTWQNQFSSGSSSSPDYSWGSIKFPSAAGATMTGPGTTSGSVVFNLSPKPSQLTTTDITVPANGTRSILINMSKTTGNPPNIVPSMFTNICVKYTRASVTQLQGGVQVPFVFNCRIKPDASTNNPQTCN